jgi:hypothetical protein
MLFFDLEFYVPVADRKTHRGSLIFNPTLASHKILGGYFQSIDEITGEILDVKSIWLWNFQQNEAKMLAKIVSLFEEQWARSEQLNLKTCGHRVTDLLVAGFAIARADLPALFQKANQFKIAPTPELYDIFMKTKTIDLANITTFLFPEDPLLYPKSAKLVVERLDLPIEEKESGKKVWELYEQEKYAQIEKRCEKEVKEMINIYQEIKHRIKLIPPI